MSDNPNPNPQPDNSAKITEILGFDPTRGEKITSEILNEVLTETRASRLADAKKRAKETIEKLIDLKQKHATAVKMFKKADAEFNKEAAKVIKSLNSMLSGQEGTSETPGEEAPADPPADPSS